MLRVLRVAGRGVARRSRAPRSLVVTIALIAGPLAAGCGPRAGSQGRAVGTTGAEDDPSSHEAVAPTKDALTGTYECRFLRAEELLASAPCSISRSGDELLAFHQDPAAFTLEGTVAPDQAGFHLTGALRCQADPCAALDGPLTFFTQSTTSYSAVVALEDGGLLNIDVVRVAK